MSCAAISFVPSCGGCELFDRHEVQAIGGIKMELTHLVADTITRHIRHNVVEDSGKLAGVWFVYRSDAVAQDHSCFPYRGTGTQGEGSIEGVHKRICVLNGKAEVVFPHIRGYLFFGDRHAVIAVVLFVGLEGDFCIGMQELDFYVYHVVYI